ncbi:porin [Massilia putida]|uniref:porin n=1 Tax=Massilia putida TaxID=1141883 RepID=UPI0009529E90|nr:porin [Massilia putida]
MKKTIMAALALAASSSGAFAQTNVTLYGLIDLAVQSGRTNGATTTRVDSSAVAPTRFGFQGSEGLGGGTQAIFRLESGFNADTGAVANNGVLFGREAWVGLKGGLGQVQVGVNYTPLFLSYVTYSLGELNTLGWGNATNNFVFVPAARTANSIRYTSPALAGFTLRLFHGLGNENADGQPHGLGKTSSAAVTYRNGALAVDVDYLQQVYANTAALTSGTPAKTGRYYLLGASYDFGLVKPALIYQSHGGSDGVAAAIGTSFANPNNHFYELNALIRATPRGTLLVSYGQYTKRASSSGNAKSYGLRHDYLLSKRTGLYAGISRVQNDSAASFTVSSAGGPGIAVAPGQSINSVIFGTIHRF